MKFINLIFQIIVISLIMSISFYWFNSYRSAFEADQNCHADLSNYVSQTAEFGCDHDLETHQWILYQDQGNSNSAKIIKRFRYKFL